MSQFLIDFDDIITSAKTKNNIKRNAPCYCGSGKKYKKCCLNSIGLEKVDKISCDSMVKDGEEKCDTLIRALILRYQHVTINEEKLGVSIHQEKADTKSFVLTCLEQILFELSKKEVDDKILQYLYVKILKLWLSKNFGNMSRNELVVVEAVAKGGLADYTIGGIDYDAMRIGTEFAYQAIVQGISDEKEYNGVTLHVDTNDVLVSWDLHVGNLEQHSMGFFIEWNVLDKQFNEYKMLSNKYPNFEEQSLKLLATTRVQENRSINKSQDLLSYNGWVINYVGVFERELRNILKLFDDSANEQRIMLRKMCDYIANINSSYFNFINFDIVDELIRIRNKAAHGESVTKEEFEFIKDILIDSLYLEELSQIKSDLRDEETVNHFKLMKFIASNEGKQCIKEFQETEEYKTLSKELENTFNECEEI